MLPGRAKACLNRSISSSVIAPDYNHHVRVSRFGLWKGVTYACATLEFGLRHSAPIAALVFVKAAISSLACNGSTQRTVVKTCQTL